MALAAFAGPRPLGLPPDPTTVPTHPRPDWFLVWYYSLLAVKPRGWEDATMVYLPIVAFLLLVALPFLRSTRGAGALPRPAAVAVTVVVALALGSLTVVGYRGPWVPDFETRPFTQPGPARMPTRPWWRGAASSTPWAASTATPWPGAAGPGART
jgi:ubiquinol-cytochrome c reductase cytochrome b subunit